jgi:hypothetical protein
MSGWDLNQRWEGNAAWTRLNSCYERVPDAEVTAVLAAAIYDWTAGTMTCAVEAFVAGVSAASLVDQMAMAGLVLVRRAER